MGLCCYLGCLESLVFAVGFVFLLRWTYFLFNTIYRIYFGTQVTTERYGKDSWAVVTGSTDGIGKGLALELASRGFNLVLISRTIEKLNAVAIEAQEAAKKAGKSIHTRVIAFDFSDDTSVQAYQGIKDKIKDLDISILVNNVGYTHQVDRSTKIFFDETTVNCYPIVLLTQQVVSLMTGRKGKKSLIINFSSQAALSPTPGFSSYSATKVFDWYFSNAIAHELRRNDVDVLSVLPGMVATPLTGRKVADIKEVVITPKQCADGVLGNATSGMTHGGAAHEVTAYFSRILVDLIPINLFYRMADSIGKQLQQQFVKLQKADKQKQK
ncbi:hypothetical protein FGO68_gene4799 [Halteria grandinella]|uniref:Uncharacterized protein n=1 Tax=Halteria grandinella TaxID=5974 RepID=A0A8J8NKI3_HALGN|nr:hypothetical protein FGO68_gene4799 [Halteria grandinella]